MLDSWVSLFETVRSFLLYGEMGHLLGEIKSEIHLTYGAQHWHFDSSLYNDDAVLVNKYCLFYSFYV